MLRRIIAHPFESFLVLWLGLVAAGIAAHAADALHAQNSARWWATRKPGHALSLLLWSQVASALLVIGISAWNAFRQKQRHRRGLCLECGHNLGPAPQATICPECGTAASVNAPTFRPIKRLMRHRRVKLFLALWLTVLIAIATAFYFLRQDIPIPNLEARLKSTAESALEYSRYRDGPWPEHHGIKIFERRIGWPWPVFIFERVAWYRVIPGEQPVRIERLDIRIRDERPAWKHIRVDPRDSTQTLFYVLYRKCTFVTVLGAEAAAALMSLILICIGSVLRGFSGVSRT